MAKDLVIMHDQQAVTTSLRVAEVFNKRHKNVIQAIENKISSAENSAQYKLMFVEGNYTDASGKTNKMYYMNRDGFTFIAFGFTGAKADQFKLEYINAFNQMEKRLQQQRPLTVTEQIQVIAKGYENVLADIKDLSTDVTGISTNVDSLSTDMEDVKNRMGLPNNMAHAFTSKRNAKIIETLGGKGSKSYRDKAIRIKTYRALFNAFCNAFNQERYNDLPMKDFDKAIDFVDGWRPPFELRQEIRWENGQLELL